jgi:hypothetical protein
MKNGLIQRDVIRDPGVEKALWMASLGIFQMLQRHVARATILGVDNIFFCRNVIDSLHLSRCAITAITLVARVFSTAD